MSTHHSWASRTRKEQISSSFSKKWVLTLCFWQRSFHFHSLFSCFAAFKYTRTSNHSLQTDLAPAFWGLLEETFRYFNHSYFFLIPKQRDLHEKKNEKKEDKRVWALHEESAVLPAACFLSHGSIYRCEQRHVSGVAIKRQKSLKGG